MLSRRSTITSKKKKKLKPISSLPSLFLSLQAIEAEVARGGQAFVVVPFISDILDTQEMIESVLPDIEVQRRTTEPE